MIKLARKIISKPNPCYDSSGQGKYANPIDAYLKEEVAFRLSRTCSLQPPMRRWPAPFPVFPVRM